jgi:hypothetical protein
MTEFKCDTRSHGSFLYGKRQSVFTVLSRLYNHCKVGAKRNFMSLPGDASIPARHTATDTRDMRK